MATGWLKGTVKAVPSGDSLLIMGSVRGGPPPEKTITLAALIAPKLVSVGFGFFILFWVFFFAFILDVLWWHSTESSPAASYNWCKKISGSKMWRSSTWVLLFLSGCRQLKKIISATLSSSLNVVGHKQKSLKSFSLQGELMGLLWNV